MKPNIKEYSLRDVDSSKVSEPISKRGEVIIIGFDDDKALGRNPLKRERARENAAQDSNYTMNYESKSGFDFPQYHN
jgi:hypothetical protein